MSLRASLSRRAFAVGALTAVASTMTALPGICGDSRPNGPASVAVMSPWIAETMLSLGLVPAALPDLRRPQVWRTLSLPPGIHDLGLSGEPNLELLDQLRLDLILLDHRLQGFWTARLGQIAPVATAAIYTPEQRPYGLAQTETLRLAMILSRQDEACRVIEESAATIADARRRLAGRAGQPVFVVRLLDARNLVLYCAGSIFHDVLTQLGFSNASHLRNDWGFATVGVETLASMPDARIVYFEPVPKEAERLFVPTSLWAHLPSVRKGLTTAIPEFYSWAALPTAARFASHLADRLLAEGNAR